VEDRISEKALKMVQISLSGMVPGQLRQGKFSERLFLADGRARVISIKRDRGRDACSFGPLRDAILYVPSLAS
jgi:hypothetical protein